MPSVLVVQHEQSCPPDRFGQWLAQDGIDLTVCRPYAGDVVPDEVGHDGLLVLGGSMGANDDEKVPWLGPVKQLLASAVQDQVPALGICLGAQLLGVACGGRVEVGAPGIEVGVVRVQWRDGAQHDALVGALPSPMPVPGMHNDAVVELPPGAEWLASSPLYPHQVFRVGAAAWGLQFHPEASVPTFRIWVESSRREWHRWPRDPAEVLAELEREEQAVTEAGLALAAGFAKVVLAPPAA